MKNFTTPDIWTAMSSINLVKNNQVNFGIDFLKTSGVICWDREGDLLDFLNNKLKDIIAEGTEPVNTDLKVVDEIGDTSWILLSDEIFEHMVSTVYTVGNALSDLISKDAIVGSVWKFNIVENELRDDLIDPSRDFYLVFNNTPIGFYPLVYNLKDREPLTEMLIFDLLKRSGLFLQKDQSKWYGIDNIPF